MIDSTIKIGIVEDEMVIANTIALELKRLKYEVSFIAGSYSAALLKLEECKPDLVLLDIVLNSKKDGIDLGHKIREMFPIPIIFLTANSDIKTIERAKAVNPNAYLVKPFSKSDLYAAIEIALSNHKKIENPITEFIIVKDGYNYEKLFFKTIMFLTSDSNYVTFHLDSGKRVMVRSTIADMGEKLNKKLFLRINRGVIVNGLFVDKILTNEVSVGETTFKVQKIQRDELIQLINGISNL